MTGKLTQFGIWCRKYRLDHDFNQEDQANALKCSVAHVSAVERGVRPVPDEYLTRLFGWFELSEKEKKHLTKLADQTRTIIRIHPNNPERTEVASLLARSINRLSGRKLAAIRKILDS